MKLPAVEARFVLSIDGKVVAPPRGAAGHPAADPALFDAVIDGRASRAVAARPAPRELRRVLASLHRDFGVRRLLCDSDPPLFRALVAGGFVKKLHVTFLPRIVGGAKAATLIGPPANSLLQRSVPLRLEAFKVSGGRAHATYALARGG